MGEFQVIRIHADTAHKRGVQYGKQAKEKIYDGIENYRNYFASKGKTWEETCEAAMLFVPDIKECMPEILEEAQGIAEGAGVAFPELMVLNSRYELTNYPNKPHECTTGAILPEASRNNGTYMVKNWDYKPGVLKNIVILHIEDEQGTRVMGLTEAGQMVREGFNSNGIGLCNNYIESIWDGPGAGIPVCFLRRRVLASKTYEEAFAWLTGIKRSVSNNMLLVSAEGKAIDVEATPMGYDLKKPIGGILTHANHFTVAPEKDRNPWEKMAKNRDIRLADLLYHRRTTIDVEYLIECLRDHEYYPSAICNHNYTDSENMNQVMTVASLIVDFADKSAWICKGNPCTGTYKKYQL